MTDLVRSLASVQDVPTGLWTETRCGNPFTSHGFLSALEDSGAVGPGTGWRPFHLLAAEAAGTPLGLMPLYMKSDSFGEFVFDWIWAESWRRAGLDYYPKFVAAVPYSPVSAPRIISQDAVRQRATSALLDAALATTAQSGASSLHLLFVDDTLVRKLEERGFMFRHDCQFHWFNRGYSSFDDFLAGLRSARRKQIRRERRRVSESGLRIRRVGGDSINPALWTQIHALTERSFLARGNPHYFNEACYRMLGERLGDRMQVLLAEDESGPVAAAVFLRSADRLFGRYWGSSVDLPGLHFELCYYRGIDYCIESGISVFEPGAQGEHKLARGFEPVRTVSAHWVADESLRGPVADWCARERTMVARYIEDAALHLPYRSPE